MENNKISKNAVRAFAMVAVLAICTTAQALEVILGTGLIKSPLFDGTFSNTSIGNAATVFLCLTDANTYNTYASDSRGLYDAWKAGEFNNEEYRGSGNTSSAGMFEVTFDEVDDDPLNTYYSISIAQYESEEFGRTYYIARTLKTVNTNNDELMPLNISPTLESSKNWSAIPEPTIAVMYVLGFFTLILKRKPA